MYHVDQWMSTYMTIIVTNSTKLYDELCQNYPYYLIISIASGIILAHDNAHRQCLDTVQERAHLVVLSQQAIWTWLSCLEAERGKECHLPAGLRNRLSAIPVTKINMARFKKPNFPKAQVLRDWDCLSGDNQDSRRTAQLTAYCSSLQFIQKHETEKQIPIT